MVEEVKEDRTINCIFDTDDCCEDSIVRNKKNYCLNHENFTICNKIVKTTKKQCTNCASYLEDGINPRCGVHRNKENIIITDDHEVEKYAKCVKKFTIKKKHLDYVENVSNYIGIIVSQFFEIPFNQQLKNLLDDNKDILIDEVENNDSFVYTTNRIQTNIIHDPLHDEDFYTLLINMLVIILHNEGEHIKPYWDDSCEEKAQNLWKPSMVNTINKKYRKNLFKFNEDAEDYKTFENDNNEETILTRNVKIRIYPNIEQKAIFARWFGTSRYIYNSAVAYYNNPKCYPTIDNYLGGKSTDFGKMKQVFVTTKNQDFVKKEWESQTPDKIRANALKEFKQNLTTLKKMVALKNIRRFTMKYKRKRKNNQCITLPHELYYRTNNGFRIYVKTIKDEILVHRNSKIKYFDKLDIENNRDYKLLKQNKKYYLSIPQFAFSENSSGKGIAAFDPGVRTFHTLYSERETRDFETPKELLETYYDKIDLLKSLQTMNKTTYANYINNKKEILKSKGLNRKHKTQKNNKSKKKNKRKRRKRRGKLLAKLIRKKKITNLPKNQKKIFNKVLQELKNLVRKKNKIKHFTYNPRRYKTNILKYGEKVKNVIDTLHNQTIDYVVKSYRNVLLPKFETQKLQMGTLHRNTKRAMNSLKHYRFKQKLINKVEVTDGLRVHIVNESYTTKTCSECGKLNNVGSSKTFSCERCEYSTGRDLNASKGLFTKYAVLR